jgi:membrane-bound ClpP family serine protease
MSQRILMSSVALVAWLLASPTAQAQREPGEWIFVPSPITSATVVQIKNQTARAIKQRQARKIVYQFQAGEPSTFGPSSDLADFILNDDLIKGQVSTHAYVDKPIKGHGVLPALACRFLYVSPEAALGFDEETLRRGGPIERFVVNRYLDIAERRGRPVALILKMIDPSLVVYQVDAPKRGGPYKLDGEQAKRYGVDSANLLSPEDRLNPRKEVYAAGVIGYYSADELIKSGMSGRQFTTAQQVAEALQLPGSVVAGNPLLSLDHPPTARIIEIRGKIDRGLRETVKHQIRRAVERERADCLIFTFQEAQGGLGQTELASELAREIRALNDRVLTVAYIPNRASGAATFIALACSQIVMGPEGVLGDCETLVYRDKGRLFPEKDLKPVRDTLVWLADQQGYSPVLVRGLMDPDLEIVQVRPRPQADKPDEGPAGPVFMSRAEATAGRDRWIIVEGPPVKKPGTLLKLDTESALNWGVARYKLDQDDPKGVALLYGIEGERVREIHSDWLDHLVLILAHPIATVFLVIVGFTCLILEFKAPGLGLPAVLAAVCFILVFWAHSSLRGEVNALAILLFLLGVVLILVELFVFPGIAVTLLSGVVLILLSLSLLMVRHWPQSEPEYLEMGKNFGIFAAGLMAAIFSAYTVARYLPHIPYANRMILAAPEEETSDAAATLPLAQSAALLGAIGLAVTELRPAGKARFGDQFVDVIAEGSFVDPGTRVQVIEIDGMRVVVKRV